MPIRGVHPGSGAHTAAYKVYIWLLSTRVRWPKRKADIYSLGRKTRQLIPPLHHMSLRRGSSLYYQWPCCLISYLSRWTHRHFWCTHTHTHTHTHTTSTQKSTSRSSSTITRYLPCIHCQMYRVSMFIHHSLLWGSVYPEGASGSNYCTVELGYSVMKGTEYVVSLKTRGTMLWLTATN